MTDEKQRKTSGKAAEPTIEELEFIYERLPKESNKEIVDDMNDETNFPRRTVAFIERRRKEYKVAKDIIGKRTEGAFDTDIVESRKRHRNRLAERAQELLNELKRFSPYTDEIMLADVVIENDDFSLGTLLDDFRSCCLFSHLQAEIPTLNSHESWSELKISEIAPLISVLGRMAEDQQYIGKCKVCKDWE
jgi:hypothetical protein